MTSLLDNVLVRLREIYLKTLSVVGNVRAKSHLTTVRFFISDEMHRGRKMNQKRSVSDELYYFAIYMPSERGN